MKQIPPHKLYPPEHLPSTPGKNIGPKLCRKQGRKPGKVELTNLLIVVLACVILGLLIWHPPREIPPPDPIQNPPKHPLPVSYNSPEVMALSADLIKNIRLPQGFSIQVFGHDLEDASMMTVDSEGVVYVSAPLAGKVWSLVDENKDGIADHRNLVVSDLPNVYGLDVHQNQLYYAANQEIWKAKILGDGKIAKPHLLVKDLPEGGAAPYRMLRIGPDQQMTLSFGGKWNAAVDDNPQYGSVLKASLTGKGLKVFAEGLGKTVGMDWEPTTQKLWGVEQGSDWTGKDYPLEELNQLKEGKHYGWPWCYGEKKVLDLTEGNPKASTKEKFCPTTEPSIKTFDAHSGPVGMVFYTGHQFPEKYKNSMFIAFHGSVFKKEPVGYKLVSIPFQHGEAGPPEDFMTGLLLDHGKFQIAGLSGLAVAPDGSLLVSDDKNGVVFRIFYTFKK
ncbi:MAG: PQQ-dependent sugar dehydrogenase [Cyanobacteria bacterium]|nr:PQQ-dependent sugar dehydrogenase [Cyanobacteriota bacterium]